MQSLVSAPANRLQVCILLVVSVCSACRNGTPATTSETEASGSLQAEQPSGEWFTERARGAGLYFVHFNGMSGQYYYPEIMAPGVGLLDYDNDGDLDVYVVQGQMLDTRQPLITPVGPLRDRLFRNDLVVRPDGSRTIQFTEVTNASGIDVHSYGMGVAVGDFNNDGFVDVYRTSLSGGTLLRNNGNGTFSDVTAMTGAANPGGWGVSASFFDYDRDGFLDLFVGNYLLYTVEGDRRCVSTAGARDYCPPSVYRPQPSRLYRNRGNGTFDDVTAKALIGGAYGPALGASTADVNRDRWPDLLVANDGRPNHLWINQQDGTFKEVGLLSGIAVNAEGNAEANMGVDAGDYDNDGDEDVFITHWSNETNTLYVNDGTGAFDDRTSYSGLGPPSLAKTGFGTAWFDFDNDSWLDLFVANGGVASIAAQVRAKDLLPLRMANQLFRNLGTGRFEEVSTRAGAAFRLLDVARGAAFGDVDNDGDTDVLVGNTAGPLRLYINEVGSRQRWLGLRLLGSRAPRDMVGAMVYVTREGAQPLLRRSRSDGSYASANDPRVLVGLGADAKAATVRVVWPDGRSEQFGDIPLGRYTTLTEGTGR